MSCLPDPEQIKQKLIQGKPPMDKKLSMLELYLSILDSDQSQRIETIIQFGSIDSKNLTKTLFSNMQSFKPKYLDLFLSYGVDVNARDYQNNTLLLSAVATDNNQLAYQLIDRNADVTLKNNYQTSVLFPVIMQNDTELLCKILEKGGKNQINSKNSLGETPVMVAASKLDEGQHLKTILQYNPDLTIRDSKNRTVFDIASETSSYYPQLIESHLQKQKIKKNIKTNKKTKKERLL